MRRSNHRRRFIRDIGEAISEKVEITIFLGYSVLDDSIGVHSSNYHNHRPLQTFKFLMERILRTSGAF